MSEANERIADEYLSAAYFSIVGRTKRVQQQRRYESYGLLKALEILTGHMEDACRLIEERHVVSRSSAHFTSIDNLLYEFWGIDRPRQHV